MVRAPLPLLVVVVALASGCPSEAEKRCRAAGLEEAEQLDDLSACVDYANELGPDGKDNAQAVKLLSAVCTRFPVHPRALEACGQAARRDPTQGGRLAMALFACPLGDDEACTFLDPELNLKGCGEYLPSSCAMAGAPPFRAGRVDEARRLWLRGCIGSPTRFGSPNNRDGALSCGLLARHLSPPISTLAEYSLCRAQSSCTMARPPVGESDDELLLGCAIDLPEFCVALWPRLHAAEPRPSLGDDKADAWLKERTEGRVRDHCVNGRKLDLCLALLEMHKDPKDKQDAFVRALAHETLCKLGRGESCFARAQVLLDPASPRGLLLAGSNQAELDRDGGPRGKARLSLLRGCMLKHEPACQKLKRAFPEEKAPPR